jgi:hypothetical protein
MNPPITGPSLAAQIANLPRLAMNDLWVIWDKYFPRRPPHHNRAYVEGRVAYKIQEEALGTKLEVQTQMARIGDLRQHQFLQRLGGQAADRMPTLGAEGLNRLWHVVPVVLATPLLRERRTARRTAGC